MTDIDIKTGMEEFINKETENTFKKAIEQEKQRINESSLQHVYETVEKWLGIKIKDRNRIDVILATALSNKLPGTPIWMFICGNSGDWKSAFAMGLTGLKNVIKIDQLTANTLASGQKDAHDLGRELHDQSNILLFPDLACLTSMNTDEKNIIWGQFRNLYDGFINKRTGSGVNKAYENCHVTLIACTTQAIRDEILIHAQLGTRELMYDTDTDAIDNDYKMDMAIYNEQYEQQMKDEIQNIVSNFITYHKPSEKPLSDDTKTFIKNEAKRLSVLRASAMVDRQYKELINPVYPEVPTRLVKQFKRLYSCLMGLEENYPEDKARQIITHVVNSSGNKVRQIILEHLLKMQEPRKISDIMLDTKLGRGTIKAQLEICWNIGIVNKEVREEQVGGYCDFNGERRGGRFEDVAYYSISYEVDNPHSPPLYQNINNNIHRGGE